MESMRNIYKYCKVLLCTIFFLILMIIPNVSVYAEAKKTSSPQIEYSQPSDDQTIAKGAKGEEVCWIQAALNQVINANLIVDGDFGNNTETALKTFQTKCGIEADGIANAKTIAELKHQVTGERQETKEIASESTTSTEHTKNVRQLPKISREHLFIGYWKTFFIMLKNVICHFKVTTAPLIHTSTLLGKIGSIILVCFVLMCLIPVSVAIFRGGDDPNIVTMPFGEFLGESGCLGSIVKLFILPVLLSPLFCDMYFIKSNFDAGWLKILFVSCCFVIFRIILSIIGGIAVWILSVGILYCITYVLKFIIGLPSFIISLIYGKRQYYKDMLNSEDYIPYFKEVSPSNAAMELFSAFAIIPALAIFFLINIMPLIMASWVN